MYFTGHKTIPLSRPLESKKVLQPIHSMNLKKKKRLKKVSLSNNAVHVL